MDFSSYSTDESGSIGTALHPLLSSVGADPRTAKRCVLGKG